MFEVESIFTDFKLTKFKILRIRYSLYVQTSHIRNIRTVREVSYKSGRGKARYFIHYYGNISFVYRNPLENNYLKN